MPYLPDFDSEEDDRDSQTDGSQDDEDSNASDNVYERVQPDRQVDFFAANNFPPWKTLETLLNLEARHDKALGRHETRQAQGVWSKQLKAFQHRIMCYGVKSCFVNCRIAAALQLVTNQKVQGDESAKVQEALEQLGAQCQTLSTARGGLGLLEHVCTPRFDAAKFIAAHNELQILFRHYREEEEKGTIKLPFKPHVHWESIYDIGELMHCWLRQILENPITLSLEDEHNGGEATEVDTLSGQEIGRTATIQPTEDQTNRLTGLPSTWSLFSLIPQTWLSSDGPRRMIRVAMRPTREEPVLPPSDSCFEAKHSV
ncbi:hypothetical protein QFC21_002499 [Naganishia friedmannii]|uniref:Uncharacterized protein n=1 Tax=Naganishia friedmannii TaxID=89922 RepID=A0ACC2VW00_9TREE|nr:hypothetical protein QFC21_002499 [Naganishia friedmannii]